MTDTKEVALPELPYSSLLHLYYKNFEDERDLKRTSETLYTAEQMRTYAKEYGVLCYEAGYTKAKQEN